MRNLALDNLRALAMLAGVVFHAALAHSPLLAPIFPTADTSQAAWLDALLWPLHLVRMPLFFVIAGVRNFLRFADRVAMKTNYGWTIGAPATAAGFTVQLVAGACLALGVAAVWSAAALIVFLVAATTLYHNFTLFQGEARLPHLYFTLVNCALVGYCLMAIGAAL